MISTRKIHYPLLNGFLLLTAAQSMVGFSIVSSKFLVTTAPIFLLLLVRFSMAALTIAPLHWLTSARKIPVRQHLAALSRKDWLFILAQALSAGLLFNCFMLLGLNYTDANVAGIITSALPAIIAVMSWLLLGEAITGKKSVCIFLATIGLIIIALGKFKHAGINHSFIGDFIILFSLLPEATYYVLCKLHSNRLPVFLVSSLLNGINAILLLPVLFFIDWQTLSMTPFAIFLILLLGISSGLFYVFWYFGSMRVDSILASLSTAIMPVATVLIARVALDEKLTGMQLTGMGLVLLSIFIYARR
ncbi:DMT family transporter [Legionella spiritensis]|uniref:DMT family transporter n=1 Tax=Legionella spiritensis TaxID=452 RepID=UPI000F6CC45D|nr:DMT family transporter [Legionella spiritensis]VEG90655.1 transmembrane protein [Legionella spiritensis]